MSILGRIEIEIDFYFDFVSTIARLYSIIYLNILQILHAIAINILHIYIQNSTVPAARRIFLLAISSA